jgi:hypothetical protein
MIRNLHIGLLLVKWLNQWCWDRRDTLRGLCIPGAMWQFLVSFMYIKLRWILPIAWCPAIHNLTWTAHSLVYTSWAVPALIINRTQLLPFKVHMVLKRSNIGIAGSNPARGIGVYPRFSVFYCLVGRDLRWAEPCPVSPTICLRIRIFRINLNQDRSEGLIR